MSELVGTGPNGAAPGQAPDARLKELELLVCDVDGVLTDGRLTYGDGGEAVKTFHVRDGLGLKLLMANGVQVGIITARSGAAVSKRMSDLGIENVQQGRGDKGVALQELMDKLGVDASKTAYIGDDIIDLPAIRMAGVGITVRDGHAAVLREADWVTERGGGQGAVREVADEILDAKVGLSLAIESLLAGS